MRILAATLVAVALFSPSLAQASACLVTSTGLDTVQADFQIVDWYSNQSAQIFDAPDTVLQSITVFVWPGSYGFRPGKLYVMEVDTLAGGLEWPDASKLLLDGPNLTVPSGDGIHPTPMTWNLDPPLLLPHRGQFAFEVAPGSCGEGSIVFLGRSGNPYPGGSFWKFDTGGCGPGCCPDNPWSGTIDLAFRADFCESVVAVEAMTWGRLRAAYR